MGQLCQIFKVERKLQGKIHHQGGNKIIKHKGGGEIVYLGYIGVDIGNFEVGSGGDNKIGKSGENDVGGSVEGGGCGGGRCGGGGCGGN